MKVLIVGARGQLGVDLCAAFADDDVHGVNSDTVDISDGDAVRRLIADDVLPNVVVNTAAAHDVPKCEVEPEWAYRINVLGSKNLAQACDAAGARLIQVSTDYVFGNGAKEPLIESDLPAPLSIYGITKLAGEHVIAAECDNHQIVRVAAIYGTSPCRAKGGKNFVDLMLHLAKERGEVKVVTDEITSPTYTGALAKQIRHMAAKGDPGLYHVTCNGQCSWYEFAEAIFRETGTEVKLNKATNADFPSPVQRPDFSVLRNHKLQEAGLDIMPDWQTGLQQYLAAKKG
jgi:dTDP-4-dehydrorhamnose reductase